ncbi:beta-lactamase/transpeptidase-like protein [Daldinia bambusicola]|nr:beta-lactamase/transpeptidase-like protein [Daldinia bambusicola]
MKSLPFLTLVTLLFGVYVVGPVNGIPNCPYPGPAFPKPTALASSDIIKTAIANLTATFDARGMDPGTNPNGTSWSIQVFSASDPNEDEPIWSHYHTATDLLAADTPGVKSIDGNTVYRLGSVTKIFTILTFLIEAGDTYWNTPVTQWVPELELLAGKAQYDPIMNVDWDSITLQDLASHMAGIVRDWFPASTSERNAHMWREFFSGLGNVPPSFSPSWTTGYSNAGYQILAYALEAITQKQYANMLQADIIDKLGLEHTFYQKPDDTLGVIPQGQEDNWAFSIGEASPTGNMYSSVTDLSRLARAIFRHTLVPPAQTRRWLKPTALTADLREGVGSPWGIRRIPLTDGSRVVDAYSKAGSINVYMSLLVLLPDYDVGVTALLAGGWPGNANWDMADAIGAVLVPALEDVARAQADASYAGTYTADTTGEDGRGQQINSSLVLTTDPTRPGLGVERWISNGTDMLPVAVRYTLNYNVTAPAIRLYPTGVETGELEGQPGVRKVAFKAVVENLDLEDQGADMFSTNCGTWVSQTTAVYADMPLDQFVFTVEGDGRAVSVVPLALRTRLRREE